MNIKEISVKNFRLLNDVQISLADTTTLVVGRNNSGKTSLTEIFKRIFSDRASSFSLEDFSLSAHEQFWEAYQLYTIGKKEEEVREVLPFIEVRLDFEYEKEEDIGALGHFVIDLNTDCTTAIAVVKYELGKGKIKDFFSKFETNQRLSHKNNQTLKYDKSISDIAS